MYDDIKAWALSFPGAHEDHPWGESVVKVDGKVFVFLGMGPDPDGKIGFSVKLPTRAVDVLELPYCTPTGYGLGKAGWVSVQATPDQLDLGTVKGWVEESYRAVAKKKRIKELDQRSAPA